MNEDARIDHRPYASMLRNHKARLIVLWLHGASDFQISWPLQGGDKISLPIVA
jgi:hypothetical protein